MHSFLSALIVLKRLVICLQWTGDPTTKPDFREEEMDPTKPRDFFNECKSKRSDLAPDGREEQYTYEDLQKHDGTGVNIVRALIIDRLTAVYGQGLTLQNLP
jgi:hypothetical protein